MFSMSSNDRQGGKSRRSFLRNVVGGLALAIPAIQELSTPAQAAKPTPCLAACESVYAVYKGHDCGRHSGSCPTGKTTRCIGTYYFYCTCSGQFCFSEFDDEGPCKGN